MRERDRQLKLAHRTGLQTDWEVFRTMRRQVKSKIRQAERAHVQNEIFESKGNISSIWKTTRRCLNPSYGTNLTLHVTMLMSQRISTACKFDFSPVSLPHLIPSAARFTFNCVPFSKISDVTMAMHPISKSPGHDEVSIKVLKAYLPTILLEAWL